MRQEQIRGVVGEIKWEYYTAAAINNYVVTKERPDEWRLKATVVRRDAFKLAQRPLVFVAPFKVGRPARERQWRWRVLHHEFTEAGGGIGRLDARLGPREEVPL